MKKKNTAPDNIPEFVRDLPRDEIALIAKYRALSPEEQTKLSAHIKKLAEKAQSKSAAEIICK